MSLSHITLSGRFLWPALIAGFGMLPLEAQPLTCSAAVAVPLTVRAEGLNELVSDIVVTCTGGTRPAVGSDVAAVNVTVSLNVPVTSRILSSAANPPFMEALLIADEAGSASNNAPQLVCGSPGTTELLLVGVCTGYTVTATASGTFTGVPPRANVFEGRASTGNQITWLGIPFDIPGTGIHTFRFTNIRVNASSVSGGLAGTTTITAAISISGSTAVPIANPVLTVGFQQTGLTFSKRTADNSAVLTATPLIPACIQAAPNTPVRIATLRFQENFASAFRPRTSAPFTDRDTSPPPANQNVPGVLFAGESGFRNAAFPNDQVHGNVSTAGLADFGTRLRAQLTNIPAGVTILVDPVNNAASSALTARLVSSENGPFAPFPAPLNSAPLTAIPVVNGTVTLDWEVLAANPAANDSFDFGIYFVGVPATGGILVTGSLAPPISVVTPGIPIPAFSNGPGLTPLVNLGTVGNCSTVTVSPPSLAFNLPPGAAPASQTLKIAGGTAQPQTIFAYTLTGGNWLSVSKNSFIAQDTVSVTANPAGLSGGTYSGLLLATAAGSNNAVLVGVTLVVGPSSVTVSPPSLALSWIAGSATPPPPATLSVTSGTPIGYTVVSSANVINWFTATPSTGNTPGTITVSVNTANLVFGLYTGTITITPAGAPAVVVNLSMGVTGPPPFRVNPPVLTFSGSPGSRTIAPQPVQVIANGVATPFNVAVQSGVPWLTATPAAGTATSQFLVNASAVTLTAGKYAGRLLVTSTSGPSFSAAVDVALTVGTSVLISDTKVSLSVRAGQPALASKTISVSASDGSQIRFTPTVRIISPANVSWLSVDPKGISTTPTQLTLTMSAQGLGLGSFLAAVQLTPDRSGGLLTALDQDDNCPQQIVVTGDTAASPFGVSPNALMLNDANPDGQFGVTNLKLGTAFTVGTSSCWLKVSLDSKLTPIPVTAHADGSSLGPNAYSGGISVLDGPGSANGATVTVNFVTKGGNATTGGTKSILLCPECGTGISRTYRQGDPPISQRFQMQSSAGTPIAFSTHSSKATWLSANSGATPDDLVVKVDTSGLAAGDYNDSIIIDAPGAANATALPSVAVHLTVQSSGQNSQPKPAFLAAGITSAASFVGGTVSPGEIITIFGSNLGAPVPPGKQPPVWYPDISTSGFVDNIAAGTRVLFDGKPAPMVYASPGQVSVVAPFAIQGQPATQIQVEYQGLPSDPVSIPVVAARPAIFTVQTSGVGPGVIQNQNFGLNTASSPARRGNFVVIYATGGGVLPDSPNALEGALATGGVPISGVSVRIGGVDAQVLYAGAAPGEIVGVVQINAIVPVQAPTGSAVPIDVSIAGPTGTKFTSPPGVTLAVN
jgi:uncharacterized protein (TIGR03437 family)